MPLGCLPGISLRRRRVPGARVGEAHARSCARHAGGARAAAILSLGPLPRAARPLRPGPRGLRALLPRSSRSSAILRRLVGRAFDPGPAATPRSRAPGARPRDRTVHRSPALAGGALRRLARPDRRALRRWRARRRSSVRRLGRLARTRRLARSNRGRGRRRPRRGARREASRQPQPPGLRGDPHPADRVRARRRPPGGRGADHERRRPSHGPRRPRPRRSHGASAGATCWATRPGWIEPSAPSTPWGRL